MERTAETAPRLMLLGAPRLLLGGCSHALPVSTPTLLLVCLGVHGDWVARERLALLFWPEAAHTDAQRLLRVTLHRARQWLQGFALGARLAAERRRVCLQLDCDVPAFRAAIGRSDWGGALALHAGPLLQGIVVRGLAALEEWLSQEAQALDSAWRQAALSEAARLEQRGDARAAAALLIDQMSEDPLAEDMLQSLLRLAVAADQRRTALQAFERFRRRTARELGLEPLASTLALATALRQLPDLGLSVAQHAPPRNALPAVLCDPPWLGRATELRELLALTRPMTVVYGEPGLGKTRLVARAWPGALWLRSSEPLQAVPLLPIAQALERHLKTLQAMSLAPADRRELARLLPALAPHETLPPVDAASPRLLQVLADLLVHWRTPLVADDLQWLDAASRSVLARVAGCVGATAIVATLRPAEACDELARWLDGLEVGGRLQRVVLSPLAPDEFAQWMQILSGQPAPRFAAWLAAHSGGNPFFAREILATLFEGGQFQSGDDGWSGDLDAQSIDGREYQVPASVAAVVRRRVEGLSAQAQRVLTIAAIAGDARQLETLAEVAGLSPWATGEALAETQAAGLLRERTFAHDLVREALLSTTPEPLRAVLHAGIARRLANVLAPHELARHWWGAGDEAQAVAATLVAAQQDRERGLLDAATSTLDAAAARVRASDARARIEVARAATARCRGNLATARHFMQAALDSLPSPVTRLDALLERFELAMLDGNLEVAAQTLQAARETVPDAPALFMAGAKLAHAQGDYSGAAALLRQHVGALRRLRPGAELAAALTSLASVLDSAGQLMQGLPLHHEALALARRIGARYVEVEVASNLVWSLDELGRLDEAIELGEHALALGEYDASPTLATNLAWVYLRLQRLDDAERLYELLTTATDSSVVCVARGKLLEIAARRGHTAALVPAVEATLTAIGGTEIYAAQVGAIIAVIEHGGEAAVQSALRHLRDQPLDPGLRQRLAIALARRGLSAPA